MAGGCTLLILAGGASRRMGRDKVALPVGETTLIEHLLQRVSPVVDEAIVAGGSVTAPGARLVVDHYPGAGPLAGMHAGFIAAHHPWVWVVACDLPDVEPALLELLVSMAEGVDAVVPIVGGEQQGLCALYRCDLAPRIEALLQTNVHSVRALLAAIGVRYLDESELRRVDPQLRSFRNLNTPADYEAWIRTR
jgi:molybdopterin-guanine dinucleotide biosynthesis protein A